MNLGILARSNFGAIAYFCCSVSAATTLFGCGADEEGSTAGTGGSGNTTGTGGSISTPNCTGAAIKVPAPYTANNAFDDMSAFAVDEQGLVFSALPDDDLGTNASELPNVLMTSDLAGNVIKLRESVGFFSNPVFDGDDVIFTDGFVNRQLLRVPRKGGSETVLAEGIHMGAFANASSLFYFAFGDTGGMVLYSLPRAGGTPKALTNRGSMGIRGFAIEGDTLYWSEQKSLLDKDPVDVYSMEVDAAEPTLIASTASDTAGGLAVSGGVVFSTLIADSFDLVTFRVDAGKAPAPMGETGLPFLLADGKAYYGSTSGGVTRNTLAFNAPSTVSGTEGKSIYAIGSGPSDLWYATLGCIFRTAK